MLICIIGHWVHPAPLYAQSISLKPYINPKTGFFCYTQIQQDTINLTLQKGVTCISKLNQCEDRLKVLQAKLNRKKAPVVISKTEQESASQNTNYTVKNNTFKKIGIAIIAMTVGIGVGASL